MEDKIENLRKEFNDRLDKLKELLSAKEPSYKVGAWNKHTKSAIRLFINEVNGRGSLKGYGVGWYGAWTVSGSWYGGNEEETLNLIPMTKGEIIEMITAECKKRGIVDGATIERPEEWSCLLGMNRVEKLFSSEAYYDRHNDRFFIDGFLVYHAGQFAKVAKDEPKAIEVGGSNIEYGRVHGNQYIFISQENGTTFAFTKSAIEEILKNFPDNK